MAKKIRPSLKDYLRTGVVRLAEEREPQNPAGTILALLSERDRHTWEPILNAGTQIQVVPLDIIPLREEFRNADRDRFTYYLLTEGEEHLRPIRTSVQIREPVKIILKWDEMGKLTLYERS